MIQKAKESIGKIEPTCFRNNLTPITARNSLILNIK